MQLGRRLPALGTSAFASLGHRVADLAAWGSPKRFFPTRVCADGQAGQDPCRYPCAKPRPQVERYFSIVQLALWVTIKASRPVAVV